MDKFRDMEQEEIDKKYMIDMIKNGDVCKESGFGMTTGERRTLVQRLEGGGTEITPGELVWNTDKGKVVWNDYQRAIGIPKHLTDERLKGILRFLPADYTRYVSDRIHNDVPMKPTGIDFNYQIFDEAMKVTDPDDEHLCRLANIGEFPFKMSSSRPEQKQDVQKKAVVDNNYQDQGNGPSEIHNNTFCANKADGVDMYGNMRTSAFEKLSSEEFSKMFYDCKGNPRQPDKEKVLDPAQVVVMKSSGFTAQPRLLDDEFVSQMSDLDKLINDSKCNSRAISSDTTNIIINETKETNPKDTVGVSKVPMSTVSGPVFMEVGLGMMEGALKYGRHNYREAGVRASVYFDGLMRHTWSWWEGEDIDADSGLNHITKAITDLVVLRDSMIRNNWTDDRPPKVKEGWIQEFNKKAAELIKKYPNPVPAYTQINTEKK